MRHGKTTARTWVAIAGVISLAVGFVLLAVNDPGLPYGERKAGLEVVPIIVGMNGVWTAYLWPWRWGTKRANLGGEGQDAR